MLIVCLLLCSSQLSYAQPPPQDPLGLARQFAQNKEYDKAIPIFSTLYAQAPFDINIYNEYLKTLMAAEQYDSAISLVSYMAKVRRQDPTIMIDLGKIYQQQGKNKKANQYYDSAVAMINDDGFQVQSTVAAFIASGNNNYAIKIYEKLQQLTQNPYLYASDLAALYSKEGEVDKAVPMLINLLTAQPSLIEDIKTSLLSIIADRDKNKTLVEKELNKAIGKQPEMTVLYELQTWLYTRDGDYDKALKQTISLDKKLGQKGNITYKFAQMATKDEQYAIALSALDYIISLGKDADLYQEALLQKINLQTTQLQTKFPTDESLLQNCLSNYSLLFQQFPQYTKGQAMQQYAMLQARYAGNVDTAIQLLDTLINTPGLQRSFVGYCKLDLGDYEVVVGKVWQASLVYTQVDKEFKEAVLGEEARFRNAKLAYYRGDFKWAQDMLNILKASTSDLIANDALYLSVLITENTPADSNMAPLLSFSNAELLLFQNKTKQSDRVLDSLATANPQSPLQDDILMLRSKIAMKENRFQDAASFLQAILDKYGEDILGDDAAFQLGMLYYNQLHDKAKAISYFEKLIMDYPGSTFVQQARAMYNKLKGSES